MFATIDNLCDVAAELSLYISWCLKIIDDYQF